MRRLVQLIFIGAIGQWAFYGIFRCPFIVPFVNCGSCPVVTCWGRITAIFFGFWLFIPVLVIFLGRAFCGWLCPGGFVNQMLGKFAVFKLKMKNNKKLRYAQIGMVISVLISLGVYFIWGNPRVMIPMRTSDEYLNAIIMSFKFSDWYWAARTAIVISLIVASLIIANLWCRFVCPTGGVMELLRKISIFRVYKTDACDHCNACLRKCEMGTRPDEINCTNCGDCLNVCHVDAIKFGRKKS
ncbi:4Fe-4S binding protein [Campylobacter sp. RM9344]|uniref:4Fe-4S binding protein n=1 Tax=Campylobacter californiensis TaxID=1032243 RepID=A0AAW3ZVW9_9BACT|nr:4Fe-4S binding protein [Campylobacter sp. RM6883]MBE2995090.1 4Fe-4S binding protein [Campylobacter sp. RM6913]MBE3029011.1 4Fe-4S binding protein [Campylobacter sp. RM9344]MBE3607368.1 4Fe-4S binding protein [Campylobacter sp. RM9337]